MKKYLLAIVILLTGFIVSYKIVENNKYNERWKREYECYSKTFISEYKLNNSYFEEKYKILKNNKIKLFRGNNGKYLEVKDGDDIFHTLIDIVERNKHNKKDKKLSKKEIIGNTFGFEGYKKTGRFYIPKELQERILTSKKNSDVSSRKSYDALNYCRIIEILEDSIEYNNRR
jgi:hypothetical protein